MQEEFSIPTAAADDRIVVAFRTHVWDEHIALIASKMREATEGLRLVVVADESNGPLDTGELEKVSHTADFSSWGLPLTPEDRTLWFNADYPLFALRREFPDAELYVMIENDVIADADLAEVFRAALAEKVDFLATNIAEPAGGWPWVRTAQRLQLPLQRAWIQILGVSARGVDALLEARLALLPTDDGTETNWPYCEVFIPTVLHQDRGFVVRDLVRWRQDLDFSYYSAMTTRAYEDSRIHTPRAVVHPVLPGPVAALKRIANQDDLLPVLDPDSDLSITLGFGEPETFWPVLAEKFARTTLDPALVHQLGKMAVARGWVGQEPAVNWALARPSTMSSILADRAEKRDLFTEAARGTDGLLADNSGFHTARESCPWWQVDLGRQVDVDQVVLHHRGANRDRARRLQILVSVDGVTWRTAYVKDDDETFGSSLDGKPLSVDLHCPRTRFVRVALTERNFLHLDQVEVYGSPSD